MRYTVEVNEYGTFWYKEGTNVFHREDGPAVEYADGTKRWFINGRFHREDGPAIELADGYKAWFVHDQLHRENGPAVEYPNGTKQYWVNGYLHREDGPAVDSVNRCPEYWLNGECFSEEEYQKEVDKLKTSCDNKIVEMDGKRYKLTLVEED